LNSFFCQQAKGNLEVVQQPIFLAAFGPVEFGLINTQIKLEVKVAPGAIPQTLIVQEIKALQATWVTFDRNAHINQKYLSENLTCRAVQMKRDGFSIEDIGLLDHSVEKAGSPPILT
jgi:hypothetical protein